MKRRSRTTRVLKCVGISGCGLLLLMWAASCAVSVSYTRATWRVEFGSGVIRYVTAPAAYPMRASGFTREGPYDFDSMSFLKLLSYAALGSPPRRYYTVPLFIPLMLLAILTGFLCWRDRRRFPPGHCQHCGYNLTGNVSGRCPECGEAVQ